jgi:glycerophosphoryl diester phosphodiesterase
MPALIIAHRACPRHAPENSIEGIRRAAELGADGVEVDIQRTLDGVPVLMHDWTLGRTTGLPLPVRLLPYSLVRRLRLKGGAERVPSLAKALDALPDGLLIALEVKHASATAAVIAEVRRRGLECRALIWSPQAAAVRHAAAAPEIESSLLRDARSPAGLRRFLGDAVRYGARGVSVHWRAVTSEFIAEAHARGLKVYSLSPDVESTVANVACGLDGAITDWPAEVRAALARRAKR